MELQINLAAQEIGKLRYVSYAVLAIAVILLSFSLILGQESFIENVLLWIPVVPGAIACGLYFLARRNYLKHYFPILTVNERYFERSTGGLFPKTKRIEWSECSSF